MRLHNTPRLHGKVIVALEFHPFSAGNRDLLHGGRHFMQTHNNYPSNQGITFESDIVGSPSLKIVQTGLELPLIRDEALESLSQFSGFSDKSIVFKLLWTGGTNCS